MNSDYQSQIIGESGARQRNPSANLGSLRRRMAALFALSALALTSCVIPMDTGANAAAMALDEMDNLAYSLRDENAQLQVQIDSLAGQLHKTDSLLRWVANLTGNPIPTDINWSNFELPTSGPPVTVPPPDTGAARTTQTKPPPE